MDLQQQAWAAFERGDFTGTQALFRSLPAGEGDLGLGYVLAACGRYGEARRLYTRRRADVAGDLPREHVFLHQLGMVERMAGDFRAALHCFQQEATLIAALNDPPLAVCANACELGTVWQELGEPQRARTHFEQALSAGRACGDLTALGCAERGLGDWHAAHSEQGAAALHWRAALNAFVAAGDEIGAQETSRSARLNCVHDLHPGRAGTAVPHRSRAALHTADRSAGRHAEVCPAHHAPGGGGAERH